MKYGFGSGRVTNIEQKTVVCFTAAIDGLEGGFLKDLDEAVDGSLTRLTESEEFSGKAGEIASFDRPAGYVAERLILVGLGDAKKVTADSFRRAGGSLSSYKGFTQSVAAAVFFGEYADAVYFQAMIEGYLLGSFKLRDYKTGDAAENKVKLAQLSFVTGKSAWVKRAQKAVEKGTIIAEGQLLVRTLTLTPAMDLTPKLYAERARKLARKYGLTFKALDKAAIVKEKMGALMGVAVGSEEPPRFLILQHNGGREGQKPVVLVGKGVTFDSGGISLKPGLNMHEMKQDMAGSAVVVATLVTAARLGLKQNIVGLVPATENMPSGHATRPGDILTSRKGKTIEIINTDAEGRLILADALDYANIFDPQAVIDIATLTGASLYILGYAGAPIMGNSTKLLDRISDAADNTNERVWQLPIWDDHREQMKSSIADLVNSGGRPAGTIAAGAFLEYFVGDWPWAHIDIAYVDLEPKGQPYIPKGATGFGCRLLIDMLSNWKKM